MKFSMLKTKRQQTRTDVHSFARPQSWLPLLLASLFFANTQAETSSFKMDDLTEMSLEELMNIEVTSVAKKPQRHGEVAAALFVISNQDLQRWGVNNIPDALRMVPGLHVARIDANKWAVTSRGFNSRFANKLLVLIDGRSVYTPLFAGVYWETVQTPIEDIERIEVIRGSGGTVWGANAVNGVINIITRDASRTQGTLVSATAGTELRGAGMIRHGGTLGEVGHYRAYGQYVRRDNGYDDNASTHDDSQLGQVGFRSDWSLGKDQFTLQGDYLNGTAGLRVTTATDPAPAALVQLDNTELENANLLFRWQRTSTQSGDFSVQVYLDHVGRDGIVLFENRDIFDLEFQHRFTPFQQHDVTWGIGYRNTHEQTDNNANFVLDPDNETSELYSAFIQDEISLFDDKVAVTLGTKIEHNDFTGVEIQPSLRLAWTPDQYQTLWGAFSRAVRTPARGEHDVRLRVIPPPPAPPLPVFATGNDDYESEELTALEIGYRRQLGDRWAIDAAAYYNRYENLRTFDPVIVGAEVNLPFENNMKGNSKGVELSANWLLTAACRLQASYTWSKLDLELENGSTSTAIGTEESTPTTQWSIRSFMDLPYQLEWSAAIRHVGDTNFPMAIDDYIAVDTRLGWQATKQLSLGLTAQNIFDEHHPEGLPNFIQSQPTEVERSINLNATWRFK